ncbi:hypothetical protein ACFO6R_01950 [Eubacterium multiforme]|uniref:MFS family permease n=1 Tax=Eubacterium multiforme TaxID=83339 RepID=A0ABT9URS4_9FIRM|nr:hypothetical protein [Eubacterium multiforme]MDQ0148484.1 MFS family permease [Eubacterium multiforme]
MDKRKNIYIMYIIIFMQGLVFYGPIATLYREANGVSINAIFLIESLTCILSILFEVPCGYLGDRFGYKNTLIISNFVFFFI